MSKHPSATPLESTRRAVDESVILMAWVARVASPEVFDVALEAYRRVRESQVCLRRLQLMLDTNPGVFGVGEPGAGNARADAAFRHFLETLSYAPQG